MLKEGIKGILVEASLPNS